MAGGMLVRRMETFEDRRIKLNGIPVAIKTIASKPNKMPKVGHRVGTF